MISVALAQIRVHWARFTAIGLGIALAAGFVSATLIINASLEESVREGISQTYSWADLVVVPTSDDPIDPQAAAAVTDELAQRPGVTAADMAAHAVVSARGSDFTDTDFVLAPAPSDPDAGEIAIAAGTRPVAETDLLLDTRTAAELGLGIADEVRFSMATARISTGADSTPIYRGPRSATTDFTVVGLADLGEDPTLTGAPRAMTTSASYREHFAQLGTLSAIRIGLSADADPSIVREEISGVIDGSPLARQLTTKSVEEAVDEQVATFSAGSDFIAWMLLGCAGISVVVAVLVVSNTFSVIVAGRRRELALLRCLGATRRQLYGSVIVEGLLVGLIGSLIGVIAGIGVSAGLVAAGRVLWDEEFSSVTLAVPVWTIATGILVGVALTVSATIRPARSAIAVTPLEALQPLEAAQAPDRHSRVRRLLGWGSIILGVLALGTALALSAGATWWIVIGSLGGTLLVFGIVLCSGQIIPPVVSWLGDLAVTPWGLPGQLATLNTLRNRRRTGSTAAALLIGVTLVSMLVVGGMSTKATFSAGFAQHFPIDVAVSLGRSADPGTVEDIRRVEGVATAVLAYRGEVVDDEAELYIIDPDSAHALLGEDAPPLLNGRVTVPEKHPGDTVTVRGLTTTTLPVERSGESSRVFFATVDVGNAIGVSASSTAVLITLEPDLDVAEVLTIRGAVADALDVPADDVTGSAVDRGFFAQVIDVLLLMSVGLLFVAVLIALLGVSNTMSLSVIERRRENSLLRALGLSVAQLRALLAFEAVLISTVAALIGLGLGGALGIIGTRLITVDFSSAFVIDWSVAASLGILAVAMIAGILSALAPARRAARLSPVEGLKQEN